MNGILCRHPPDKIINQEPRIYPNEIFALKFIH